MTSHADPPNLVELYVSDACVLKCSYCFHADTRSVGRGLNTDEWMDAIGQLIDLGTHRFHLSGREPFANRTVTVGILSCLQQHPARPRLTVGAISDGFTWQSSAGSLPDGLLDYLEFSVDGPPAVNQRLRGELSARRVYSGVCNARARFSCTRLSVATTVLSSTLTQIRDMLQWTWGCGITNHYFQPMQPLGWGASLCDEAPSLEEYAAAIHDTIEFLSDHDVSCRVIFHLPRNLAARELDGTRLPSEEIRCGSSTVQIFREPERQERGLHLLVTHDGYVIPHFSIRSTPEYFKHAFGNVRQDTLADIAQRAREFRGTPASFKAPMEVQS